VRREPESRCRGTGSAAAVGGVGGGLISGDSGLNSRGIPGSDFPEMGTRDGPVFHLAAGREHDVDGVPGVPG